MTTADYLNQLEQDRSDLVDNLETQGITGLTGDETFTELVPEVLNISGGGADLNEYFTSTIEAGNSSVNGVSKSIKSIPNNTIVSGTSLSYAFYNARNLKTIPLIDTSNVTDMSYMFSYCTKLESVPLFDTSNVTNMIAMFNMQSTGNTKLTEIPAFDLSNCTNISNIFNGLKALTTLPVFNIPKVTNMSNMFRTDFYASSSLTDESLNNLLATLLTATSYSGTKTLKILGLTSTQAAKCTTLSNWSACVDAGWTTGY